MTSHAKHGEAKWETSIDERDVIVETFIVNGTVATNVRKRTDTSSTAKVDQSNPSKNSLVVKFSNDAAAKAQHDSAVRATRAALHLPK